MVFFLLVEAMQICLGNGKMNANGGVTGIWMCAAEQEMETGGTKSLYIASGAVYDQEVIGRTHLGWLHNYCAENWPSELRKKKEEKVCCLLLVFAKTIR
ncbi:hypothetical protein V7S43_015043 [Phytophthora oleae]|uniref:Pectate lyase n=1 Tax=Phytophthora oleae TaxID=2107226 RepID=A0ABD3EZX9_9STRA